jgi:hypothetical protein
MGDGAADPEGRDGISMADLLPLKPAQNPDRGLGEVLGDRSSRARAMSQGNDGSLSSDYARSAVAALDRILPTPRRPRAELQVTLPLRQGRSASSSVSGGAAVGRPPRRSRVPEVTSFDGERGRSHEPP